ncbi:MAG TPA: biotin transporter BioY [Longimicrobiales bacterium]|nr:biotin transporter BioY [Longimicrobiales bacterium]
MSEIRTEVNAPPATLAARESRTGQRVLAVAIAALLTTLGAYAEVSLPGSLVPVTLQSMIVILTGVMLGPSLGAASQIAYVAAGAAGLPVFAGGGAGLVHLFGPTGGYLLAFPAAAAAAGVIAGPARRDAVGTLRLLAGLAVASLVVFAGGVPWLAYYTGSAASAVAIGFTPFVVGSVLKLAGAFAIAWRLRERTLKLL